MAASTSMRGATASRFPRGICTCSTCRKRHLHMQHMQETGRGARLRTPRGRQGAGGAGGHPLDALAGVGWLMSVGRRAPMQARVQTKGLIVARAIACIKGDAHQE